MTIPVVHELSPAPDPADACDALAGLPYRLFLDSATPGTRLGQCSFLAADPVGVVRTNGSSTEWLTSSGARQIADGDCLAVIRRTLAPFATQPVVALPPFQGGAAGYLAYELGRTLELVPPAREDDLQLPAAVLGIYDWVIAWDHQSGQAWIISTGMPEARSDARQVRATARVDFVRTRLGRQRTSRPGGAPPGQPIRSRVRAYRVNDARIDVTPRLTSSFTREGYEAAVARVRDYILAGDIFQANISQRFELPHVEDSWALYRRLRQRNAAPFSAFLDFPEATVLSASPERFLRVDTSGHVETRPIKGTRPRGLGPEHDAHLGRELTESSKDQAENLMIVDLMRNDLSRVCRPGSVRASELFALEHYATVHHLVSTVVGRLEPEHDALHALAAAFPGGSVTGAPKIRAMEIIAELEPSARGVYCGAIGYVSLTGALDTNIAIRTAVVRDGRVTFSAGGGVTFGSDPAQEYRETLDKARGMIDALVASDGSGR